MPLTFTFFVTCFKHKQSRITLAVRVHYYFLECVIRVLYPLNQLIVLICLALNLFKELAANVFELRYPATDPLLHLVLSTANNALELGKKLLHKRILVVKSLLQVLKVLIHLYAHVITSGCVLILENFQVLVPRVIQLNDRSVNEELVCVNI